MAATVTAVAVPGTNPPSARITVAGASGNVTITRYATGFSPATVVNGGVTSVGNGSFSDYQCPIGVPVYYQASDGGSLTSSIVVTGTVPWLVHTVYSSLSVPLTLRPGSLVDETFSVSQGVFQPMNRLSPIVITDGVRKSSQTSLVALTRTAAEYAAIRNMLSDASVLLLNIPAGRGWDFRTCYVSVGDVKASRVTDKVSQLWRDVSMTLTVVDQPVPGTGTSPIVLGGPTSSSGGSTGGGSGTPPVGTRLWADAEAAVNGTWAAAEKKWPGAWTVAEAG